MIKIENFRCTADWEMVIMGMRNPMNSWDKSDTLFYEASEPTHVIMENDWGLMKRLVKAGKDHRKFMRMIPVYVDVTAPMYWWKEMDTYKIGTVRNSCSTMHKIHAKEFILDDFACDKLDSICLQTLSKTVQTLNEVRDRYLLLKEAGDNERAKEFWYMMIQLLPSSYMQKATLFMNYEVLRNIYHARKNHKLEEWHEFCRVIENELPYSELITEEF